MRNFVLYLSLLLGGLLVLAGCGSTGTSTSQATSASISTTTPQVSTEAEQEVQSPETQMIANFLFYNSYASW